MPHSLSGMSTAVLDITVRTQASEESAVLLAAPSLVHKLCSTVPIVRMGFSK